ncbi:MAG: hypothetical protein Q9163_006403, partial [Psora crenata]
NSEESSSESPSPPIARRGRFDDEEEDSDVLDSWDAAEDSDVQREKAKKATEAKVKADAEAAVKKKSLAQRIEEKSIKRREEEAKLASEEEDDISVVRVRARQREQDADLKHAEDLLGDMGSNKSRSDAKTVVADPSHPESMIDVSSLAIFNPNTKDQFVRMRETLVPILTANSRKAHYSLFLQEFSKQIVKELPSDEIKKIASGLTTLANEKMKDEKAAEKGGKKSKAAMSKAKLVASRDVSLKADTTSYADLEYAS